MEKVVKVWVSGMGVVVRAFYCPGPDWKVHEKASEWLAKHYPTPAGRVPKDQAVAHSLRKWEGLAKEVLEEAGLHTHTDCVKVQGRPVGEVLGVGAETCALCEHYYDSAFEPFGKVAPGEQHSCSKCPLAIARGGVPCDSERADEAESPWAEFRNGGAAGKMIQWLKEIS